MISVLLLSLAVTALPTKCAVNYNNPDAYPGIPGQPNPAPSSTTDLPEMPVSEHPATSGPDIPGSQTPRGHGPVVIPGSQTPRGHGPVVIPGYAEPAGKDHGPVYAGSPGPVITSPVMPSPVTEHTESPEAVINPPHSNGGYYKNSGAAKPIYSPPSITSIYPASSTASSLAKPPVGVPLMDSVYPKGLSTGGHGMPTSPMGTPQPGNSSATDWKYFGAQGPSHWSTLSPNYQSCAGSNQSPVDINPNTIGKFVHYESGTIAGSWHNTTNVRVNNVNNGVTLDQFAPGVGSVSYHGVTYDLKRIQLHSQSEHKYNGRSVQMEVQLVHENQTGAKLIVAVLAKVTKTPSTHFLQQIQPSLTQGGTIPQFEFSSLLKRVHNLDKVFSYTGSLTTPPCTEGVQWLVSGDMLQINSADFASFQQVLRQTARPVQRS